MLLIKLSSISNEENITTNITVNKENYKIYEIQSVLQLLY